MSTSLPGGSRSLHWLLTSVALAALAATAAADPPSLTDLTFLPGDDVIRPAAAAQTSPEIAAGDWGYLAVWVDQRTSLTHLPNFSGGPVFNTNLGSMWDIYAARLDADGQPIDQTPIVVVQEILNQGMPDVAWNGENWLVIWSGQRGMACCPDVQIYGARVSPAGKVLDSPPIAIEEEGEDTYWPAVGSDGENWLVVWRDWDLDAGVAIINGKRVGPDGTVLDPASVTLRQDSYNSYPVDPDLVWAGDEYLLVWSEDSRLITGQRLAADLTLLGGTFVINHLTGSIGQNPRVATDGTDFFVTYWENRYYGWSQLYGVRVGHDGSVLDPQGIALTDYADYTNFEPAVDWTGDHYLVTYGLGGFDYDLYATRVASDGTVLDPDGLPISIAPYYHRASAVAAAGGSAVVLWEDRRHDDTDIFAATIAADGSVGEHFCAALGAPRQIGLRLTPNDAGTAAVFLSSASDLTRILIQRLDPSGVAVDAEPSEVVSGGRELTRPCVAWDGTRYLVVWEDYEQNQIYARRLDAAGQPLDEPFAVMPGNQPAVAALGEHFLVVGSHQPTNHIRRPKAVRVRGSDGAVIGAPVTVGGNYALAPDVMAFGGRWLVAWEQWPSHDNARANLYAAFVDANGSAQGSFNVTYHSIFASGGVSLSASTDTGLIVWVDNRDGPAETDLYFRRILTDGSLLDPEPGVLISNAANNQFGVDAAWDGEQFVLAFTDFRNDSELDQHRGDVYGARVGAGGQIIDPDGFPIVRESIPEMLAATGSFGGVTQLGCSVFRDEAPFGAYRIGLRSLSSATVVAVEMPAIALGLEAYPNPFNPQTTLHYQLPEAGRVALELFDVGGRRVATLVEGEHDAGEHKLSWDGRDGRGRALPSGVYFARLRAGGAEAGQKLMLLR